MDKVQSAQTRVLRQLDWTRRTASHQKSHRQELFTEWNWLNTKQFTDTAIINTVRNAANKESTQDINKMFSYRNNTTTRIENAYLIYTEPTTKRQSKNTHQSTTRNKSNEHKQVQP